MDFWSKSHGHGQSSPSFSTLSPLAPPFTAGRSRPSLNDPGSGSSDPAGRFIHGRSLPRPYDSTPATFSNRVVKAEPFSRQYGEMGDGLDGGEGNCSSWGDLRVKSLGWLPTGEKAGQVPSSSTWVEPDKNGFLSNYVGYLSSEAYIANENSWHGNHANTNVKRDDTDSDCTEWLYDKPSMHVQERLVTVPTKPSCRSGASFSIGNPSGPLTSMELCGNYLYDYLTAHPDSSQSDQVSYQNETYCSPEQLSSATSGTNASMCKNMKHNLHLHDQPVDGFNGNDFHSHHRPSTSSTLFRPNITRKVEIKPYVAGKSKKGYDMNEIAVNTSSPKKEKLPKEMSVSDLKSSTEDRGISSITNPDLGNTNLTVQISSQTDNSNQISLETNDQLDLGVDSPCYKGTLSAKCSPFHVENAPLNSSFMGVMKLGDAHKRSGGTSITADSVKKHNHSDILEIENCVSLLKDHESSSTMKPSPRNENAISDTFAESFVENSSSYFDVAPNNSLISDSSMRGVNRSEKIAEQFEIYNSNESSNTSADAHFLIRSLHDLSKFACSYCCNATMLKKEDHKLLLMTITNLEACVSKTVEQHVYQGKPSGSKKVHISETDVDGVSIQNSKHTCDGPDKMTPFKSSVNSDEIFGSNMDYKIAVAKEIEKSMKKVFFAEEENPETNLYKIRWIEAEAALCSTKCEFMLDRKMAGVKGFTQQPSTAYQLSTITEDESTKEGKVGIVNSVCDHAVNNALVPNAMESTCAMAKYSAQPGKHQCLVPPSFTASDGDACASIIFRHGKLKDLIPKPQCKTLKEGHELPELMHAGSSLNAKPIVPGISQDQPCMAKSNCASNSCLLFTHEIEVANQGKEGYYGNGSFNGQYYNGEVNFVDNMVDGIRKFNIDPGSSNSFQQHTLKDHQHIEGYYATKHDHTTPDWEHVPK